jgi:hypothetical protein
MKTELIEGSETSAYTNQTPGNYPKENLLYISGNLRGSSSLEELVVEGKKILKYVLDI